MTTLERVGILAVDSSRTRAYLHGLQRAGLRLGRAIVLTSDPDAPPRDLPAVPYFDNRTPPLERLRALEVPVDLIASEDVNGAAVLAAVDRAPVEALVYSGPGGAILGKALLGLGKQFLHIHPGVVPEFRGSTTVYYSLLERGTCGASAILLNERIDEGPLVATREYPPPDDRTLIDHGYDPFIRADLLVRVLNDYRDTGRFRVRPQPAGGRRAFFIMHPVLRHIAVLSRFGGGGG